MLKETIALKKNLPFSIEFCNIGKENYHWHDELEMVLVLQGTVTYTIHHLDYFLSEGDLLIVDGEDLHRIKESSEDMLMLRMHIDLQYFSDQYPHIYFMIFACEDCTKDSATKQENLKNKVLVLRKQLCRIAYDCFNEPDDRQTHMDNISDLIFILVSHFQSFFIENKKFKVKGEKTDKVVLERIYRIFEYIYKNHSKKITLQDLGELEHLSPYYISHMIKEATGLTFQDFLAYLRVEFAQKMLIDSDHNLTYISESCGFSSPNYFNKSFKYWHGITPSEFRKNYHPCSKLSYGTIDSNKAMSMVLPYLGNSADEKIRDTTHLFISLTPQKKSKNDFNEYYPLRIMIPSSRELLTLPHLLSQLSVPENYRIMIKADAFRDLPDYLGPEMTALHEKALQKYNVKSQLIDYNEENVNAGSYAMKNLKPAGTLCEAFMNLNANRDGYVTIFGEGGALFTKENFRTPYYYLFSLLSKVNGTLIAGESNYFTVQSDTCYFVGICHSENEKRLKIHLTCGSNARGCIISHAFYENHSCFASMKALGQLDFNVPEIRESIETISSGKTEILLPQSITDTDFTFEADIEDNGFLLFEIPVKSSAFENQSKY